MAVGGASRAVSPSGLRGPVVGIQALRGQLCCRMIGCATGVGQVLSPGFQSPQRPLGGPERFRPGYFCAWFWPETRAEHLTGALEERPHGQQQENPRRAAGADPGSVRAPRPGGQLLQAARPGVRASAVKGSQLITQRPGSTRPHKPASHTREVKGLVVGPGWRRGQISTPTPETAPTRLFSRQPVPSRTPPRTPPGNLPQVTFSPRTPQVTCSPGTPQVTCYPRPLSR